MRQLATVAASPSLSSSSTLTCAADASTKKRIRTSQEENANSHVDMKQTNKNQDAIETNEMTKGESTFPINITSTHVQASESNTERYRKKTKYDDHQTISEDSLSLINQVTATATALSSSLVSTSTFTSSFSPVTTIPNFTLTLTSSSTPSTKLRCDSDSLSLIFSLLTTKEFFLSQRVSKQWLQVSHQRTSWPSYDFTSAISEFERPWNEMNPPSAATSSNHRRLIVLKKDIRLGILIDTNLARQCTALSLPFEVQHDDASDDGGGKSLTTRLNDLSLTNFPHLTSLTYNRVDYTTSYNFGVSAGTLSDSLRVLRIDSSSYFHSSFSCVTQQVPFLNLCILSTSGCQIPETSLVQLHQLEYFRLSNSDEYPSLSLIRCLRYLSACHSLRSLIMHSQSPSLRPLAIPILLQLPWKMTLAAVMEELSHYHDPISLQQKDEKEKEDSEEAQQAVNWGTLPFQARLTQLDWKQGSINESQLNAILIYQRDTLSHLSCTLAAGLTYKAIDTTFALQTFTQLKSLHLFSSSTKPIDLKLIGVCIQLKILRLELHSSNEYNLADLIELVLLEELALHITDPIISGHHLNDILNPKKIVNKYRIDSWSALTAMRSLRRLTISLFVDRNHRTSLLDVLATTLAQLSQFVRLDLHLSTGSHFELTSAFLASVTSSLTWNVMHIEMHESRHQHDLFRSNIDIAILALLLETSQTRSALNRFCVFRHIIKRKKKRAEARTTSTQHRIEVVQGEAGKVSQVRWIECNNTTATCPNAPIENGTLDGKEE